MLTTLKSLAVQAEATLADPVLLLVLCIERKFGAGAVPGGIMQIVAEHHGRAMHAWGLFTATGESKFYLVSLPLMPGPRLTLCCNLHSNGWFEVEIEGIYGVSTAWSDGSFDLIPATKKEKDRPQFRQEEWVNWHNFVGKNWSIVFKENGTIDVPNREHHKGEMLTLFRDGSCSHVGRRHAWRLSATGCKTKLEHTPLDDEEAASDIDESSDCEINKDE
eukprot:TRINITY_DN25323_c0_g2_i1.p1 TRINITY_DN25323_c0_g2~~TRINITY_DN25323_c0_g2_i1.p1  ORF type:complete len:226 (+),score=47.59 TRINITY_DN25323_c0_g2_i1:23-679(+)